MRLAIINRTAALALAIVALTTTPAFAATPAEALAQLKAAQTTALKSMKLQLKAAQAVLLLNLKAFEGTVKSGGATSQVVGGLFNDLIALQITTRDAVNQAFDAQGTAAGDALQTLPGPLNGIYPRGFTPGDGGLADSFRVQADAAIDKNVSVLRKKLAKTTTIAEKAGIGLTFVIKSPVFFKEYRWADNGVSVPIADGPEVDTIVAFSTLAATGDGRIRLGGFASVNNGEMINVDLFGTTNPPGADVPVNGRRWLQIVDVPEGNYSVIVRQEGDTEAIGSARIGVR